MSFASRYNRGRKFDVNTDGFDYVDLETLQDKSDLEKVFPLLGIYINRKSKFGDAPVAIIDGHFVNLPKHLTDDVREMLSDSETIDDIKAGKCGFRIREYDDKTYGKHCYTAEWADL